MTKQEAGREIFEAIETDIKSRGAAMSANKFPADYPVTRRTCYNIRNGVFDERVLLRLPFAVELRYTLTNIENEVINAFGSDHFDADTLLMFLRSLELQMMERGENTGSLRAVMNVLPGLVEQAKKVY